MRKRKLFILSGSGYLRSFKNAAQCDLNCQFSKSKLLEAVQEIVLLKFIERKLGSSDQLLQIVDFPYSGIDSGIDQDTQGTG